MRKVLITGSAGFIGFHLARELMAEGFRVHGFDGMTDYYDVGIKQRRHAMLGEHNAFSATEAMLEDVDALKQVCAEFEQHFRCLNSGHCSGFPVNYRCQFAS